MEQPVHDLRSFATPQASPKRLVALGIVLAIHLVAIWAFATGLAQRLIHQGEQIIKVQVVKEKPPEQPKTPPPPPPELQKPPPPFVPPPDITLQNMTPPPTAIQQVVNTPPPPTPAPTKPAPPAITSPASVGRPHECQSKYPPLAVRLNHQGKVTLGMTIEADGSVTNVHVVTPSGFDELDRGAVSCASDWHYKPAMQQGHPIAVPWQATVQYKLTG
ncbi:MAG TPA: energy transducer TonB [Rhizomicrobium sp.]|jgi:protein TonB